MQSALLPDASDEVVEVFTGDTLEEAMAYAVATLGPDLVVRRARKLRKGVQGLRGKETYEVAAVPAPRAPASEDALEDAFAALLEEAESREQHDTPPVRRTTRPSAPSVPTVSLPAPRIAEPPALEPTPEPEPVAVRVARPSARRAAPAAPAEAPAPAARRKPQPSAPGARRTTAATAPRRATTPRTRAAAPTPGTPAWSRVALVRLGLPKRVLDALPAKDPRDDLAWVRALERAFASVLPSAAHGPTVVSGEGVAGVVGIVKAAGRGMVPGTITDHGRTALATPTELALVVRSALVR